MALQHSPQRRRSKGTRTHVEVGSGRGAAVAEITKGVDVESSLGLVVRNGVVVMMVGDIIPESWRFTIAPTFHCQVPMERE